MNTVTIVVDGRDVACEHDASVAAVLINAGVLDFRESVQGSPRAPLCGMGVCYECRVTINDVPHRRACMVTVAPGMRVTTEGA